MNEQQNMNRDLKHWRWALDPEGIVWLTLDKANSAVNTLDREVIEELNDLLNRLYDKTPKGVVIQSGKSKGFIAGADINQFIQLKTEEDAFALVRDAQIIFDRLANLPIPTVALIQGFCLGGGMELALACRYRIAEKSSSTSLGLPEVNLGIHPGWGGTVRLPPLIGVRQAMAMMLTGKPVRARAAKKIGLVDEAISAQQMQRAARYYILNTPAAQHEPALDRFLSWPWMRPWMGKLLTRQVAAKAREEHYPAPFAMIKQWVKDGAQGAEAMENEARSMSVLMVTATSRNLVRDFFLQERLKGLAKGQNAIQHVHVIGAGTMGGDIAAWCALKGLRVTLHDRGAEFIAPAMKRAYELLKKRIKERHLLGPAMDRLQPDPRNDGLTTADLIIEAISENLEAKQNLFKMLEEKARPDAILATNTSSLALDQINSVMQQPQRLVGIHFFNPVAKMQLVEVVRGEKTDATVMQRAMAFVGQIGRLPLPVVSRPGFLINRILMPYLLEAMKLYEEGHSVAAIDEAALSFGMPMGPITLADQIGLDICLSVAENLSKELGREVPERLKEMVAQKQLGKKTKQGFYAYDKRGKPIKVSNKTQQEATAGETQESTLPSDVVDRMILSMLNEAVACLREGVVTDANLLDAGMIFGTGFAPFLGGPMHYAQERGIDNVVSTLDQLATRHGQRFHPDMGWQTLAGVSVESV